MVAMSNVKAAASTPSFWRLSPANAGALVLPAGSRARPASRAGPAGPRRHARPVGESAPADPPHPRASAFRRSDELVERMPFWYLTARARRAVLGRSVAGPKGAEAA